MKQLTVQQIINMIDSGELNTNQSTQRKFVYSSISLEIGNKKPGEKSVFMTTKSGALLNAVIEEHIKLPAVYFWFNTDTNQINIHDGKQRILTFYHFVKGTKLENITTIKKGMEVTFDTLPDEDKEYLLNYQLDVVENSGSSAEEELSFYRINTNSLPLTNYEVLLGSFHGTFLNGFESYLQQIKATNDFIADIGRGNQAYKILGTAFRTFDYTNGWLNSENLFNTLSDRIRCVRTQRFNQEDYQLNNILINCDRLTKEFSHGKSSLKEDITLILASYIEKCHFDIDDVCFYYKQKLKLKNDINKWNLPTHITFLNAKFGKNKELDGLRWFSKDVKDALYEKFGGCQHINEDGTQCKVTNYSKLEIDHIIPWAEGGLTTRDNAQLLCKEHNASKGKKI